MTLIETTEDIEEDPREMKVKRQWQKAVNREEQASIIKEAKALRGPEPRKEVSKEVHSTIQMVLKNRTNITY
jgi:tRNA pseudouridine-54 N-methylase